MPESRKTYRCSLEVRVYELDAFGHVNHARYVSFLEHARWRMLAEEGIGLEQFELWKRWPVVASLEVDYLRPALVGDALEIVTRLADSGPATFAFEQEMLRAGEPVVRARVRAAMVDERGKPARLPEELRRLWSDG
jgi:YbgC/YbaW family acyl-CoA thioester hydrolase